MGWEIYHFKVKFYDKGKQRIETEPERFYHGFVLEQELIERGITKERIRKYGFAFEGKTVLIGGAETL